MHVLQEQRQLEKEEQRLKEAIDELIINISDSKKKRSELRDMIGPGGESGDSELLLERDYIEEQIEWYEKQKSWLELNLQENQKQQDEVTEALHP